MLVSALRSLQFQKHVHRVTHKEDLVVKWGTGPVVIKIFTLPHTNTFLKKTDKLPHHPLLQQPVE